AGVHARSLADRLQAFEHPDRCFIVAGCGQFASVFECQGKAVFYGHRASDVVRRAFASGMLAKNAQAPPFFSGNAPAPRPGSGALQDLQFPISKFLPAMTDSIKHVTDASFESDVLKSDLPVLVDYWAEWCGPCKMIAPLLDEAAKLYEGRVTIAKLNVDDNPDTAAKFGIRGIPTLMLFKDGKAAATKVGAMSKSQLSAFLDESL